MVQGACDHFESKYGSKITLKITSPARCNAHNKSKKVRSNDGSRHTRADAMDIKIFVNGVQITPLEVYEYFDTAYPDTHGVGLYKTFTHADSRPWKARWSA